ncbi:MAG: TlpA family protein disulfide reductase [Holophagaceae bacterium]|nr:TlpA family protein disulfide reductase [Holophagaceae bacterium]
MSSMQKTFTLIGAAIVLLFAVALYSQSKPSLKVGSNAPALQVSRWVKGEGPDSLQAGKVYVVEFWATWCGPCRTTIPHLTELAHTYKDKVTFIGVSVWESGSGKEVEDKVDAFVKEMGNKMDYLVARDTASATMAGTWMAAAGQNGIPAAFIVNGKGKIAWIGHPMSSMEKAIEKVLAEK